MGKISHSGHSISPDDLDTKWTITIKELKFSKEKLQIACKTFEEKKKRNRLNEVPIEFLLSDRDSISNFQAKLSS